MPSWVPGSTVRIAQMTGNYDPDGLPHFKDTVDWGIDGTDLGANTVHRGTTFIYFGDVPRVDPAGPVHDLDAIGYIEDLKVPQHAQLAATRQHGDVTSAFFIDADGALCVVWVIAGGVWNHPSKISGPQVAPPGANIAAAHQFDNQLDVFFIDNEGALNVAWVHEGGSWQGPQRISPLGVAEPGGRLVAIKQLANQLDVLFIGRDRRLNVAWVVDGGIWQGPIAVGSPDIPYPDPGSGIAASPQGANQLDAFFIGQDGGLYVAWSTEGGAWQGPQRVGAAGVQVANPGSALVAFKQSDNQVTALVVNQEGRLTALWVVDGGVWQGPAPVVAGLHPIKPGSTIAVSKQGADQWDAFVAAADGAVHVYWSTSGQPWQGPQPIAPAASTFDDTGIAVVDQLEGQITVLFGGKTGDLNVAWNAEGHPWAGPVCINPEMVGLKIVAKGRSFFPFTIRGTEVDPSKLWTLGINETPTGAFSFEDRVYVFAVAGQANSVSYLASSDHPERPDPYKLHFAFSRGPDPLRGRFLQVAPVVVNPAEIRGLEREAEAGVIVFGHGAASPDTPPRNGCIHPSGGVHGVHLAFIPLVKGVGPVKEGARFYMGGGPQPEWHADEAMSKALFATCYYWTSLSAGRIPGSGKWIVLSQLAGPGEVDGSHHLPIVARIADQPWEIGVAEEVPIFDPNREGAWGRYMFGPDFPDNDRNRPHVGLPAFAYGAYLLNKYTQWDRKQNVVTIFYLMSTSRPYQVQLMRSSIQL